MDISKSWSKYFVSNNYINNKVFDNNLSTVKIHAQVSNYQRTFFSRFSLKTLRTFEMTYS